MNTGILAIFPILAVAGAGLWLSRKSGQEAWFFSLATCVNFAAIAAPASPPRPELRAIFIECIGIFFAYVIIKT